MGSGEELNVLMIEHIVEDTEACLQYYERKGDKARIKIVSEGVLYFLRCYVLQSLGTQNED